MSSVVAMVRRHRHRQRCDLAAWAALLEILGQGSDGVAGGQELTAATERRLDHLAATLIVNLQGEDREALARFLRARGLVDAARRATRSCRAAKRAAAAELLGAAASTTAFPDLVRLLGDRRASVRRTAARALGRTGDPYASAPLIVALEGPRALPVELVATAIFESGEPPAALLQHGLHSPSAATRELTAELLGYYRQFSAIEELGMAATGDDSLPVRLRAATALGRLGTERAGAILTSCLEQGPTEVQEQAATALAYIGAS